MYFMARHSDLDCLKKRGRKGYFFMLSDERPYPKVRASDVKSFIGDTIEADIPVQDILTELRVGIDPDVAARTTSSLVPYASTRAVVKGATVTGELAPAGSDAVGRL